MKIQHNVRAFRFWSFASIVSILWTVSVCAQTPPAISTPELSLSANHSFAPTISQGWPIVFEMEVYTPGVAQGNGNAVPITLNLPSGSWADGVQLTVTDSSGNAQAWPMNLVYHPTGTDGSIVLNTGVEGRLAWTVASTNTAAIAAGTYQAVALFNATSTTAPGAFNGTVASNSVTITVGPEPSPLPVNSQEDKYTLLATYDLLQGNQTQAMTDLNTLLVNQPNSISGMTSMGDLLKLQGQPAAALQKYDQAVATFFATYPTAPEPPAGLIDRQASLRASFISKSGKVSLPQVNVSLTNQGLQSPGVYFFDLVLSNSGTGTAEIPQLSQFSYITVAGTGQATYDTTLSPVLPAGVNSLAPGASSTVRIYLDLPASVTQFTIHFSGTAQDVVGTIYNFSGAQTITPGSIATTGAPLTITAANVLQQYGQPTPSVNNVTYNGFVNGDSPASLGGALACMTTATQSSPVGTYPITCSGLTSPNYTITYVPGTVTLTPAPLTVTASNTSAQYGQAFALNSASYSGFVNGDTSASLGGTLNCTTTATSSSPVGNYPITCSGVTSTNYTTTFLQGTLTITPAPLTISANNASRAYGVANPPLNSVSAGRFVNGDTLASLTGTLVCTTTATLSSPAGSYAILCSGLSSPDYSITYVPGTLAVSSDVLTITANNQVRRYGSPNPTFTASFAGFVNGDTLASLGGSLTCTSQASAASSVSGGPYPINCSGLTSGSYAITYIPGVLSITPAPLTIAANNAARPYGANNPAFSGTVTGLLNSDPISGTFASPTAVSASPVGAYPIVPTAFGTPAILSNYTLALINGTLAVGPEVTSLGVALSPASITVGQSATAAITLTAPDMVIPIDPSVLRPVTVTSTFPSDILSNSGVCTPVPSTSPGIASCTVTITPVEPNGRTLNAAFAGSADLGASVGTADLMVTAPLQSQQVCIASDFRNVAVPGASTIWFNSIVKVRDVPKQLLHVSFFNPTVQFQYTDASGNLVSVNQPLPGANVTMDPNAAAASTSFDAVNNIWTTTIPWDLDDNAFLAGMPWTVPAGGLPADVEPVTVCGTFASDVAGIDIGWRWAAAAYSSFSADNNVLGVKPQDTDHDNPGTNRDLAGTPESYKQFVIPGARGKGGKNYTGSYSRSGTIE
jgi:MBG domain (YGX type)